MLLYLRIEAILRATPFQVSERNTQASLLRRALPSSAVVPDLICGAANVAVDQHGRNTHAILTDASGMAFNALSALGRRLPACPGACQLSVQPLELDEHVDDLLENCVHPKLAFRLIFRAFTSSFSPCRRIWSPRAIEKHGPCQSRLVV
jgi:hypothetical protein